MIVSNWCPPFNLTAAAEVLIVIMCDVWCVYEWVMNAHELLSVCLLSNVQSVSMKWMCRLETSPYPLVWIGLAALNAQSLRSISEKVQRSGNWSGDQMYFCNLFVPWGLFAASSSLQKLLFTVTICFSCLSPSLLPPACRAPVTHS